MSSPSAFSSHDFNHPDGHGFILTIGRRWVNLIEPRVESIDLEDIIHGLSHVPRFNGHTPAFYSVAEHSLSLAAQLHRTFGDDELTFSGLFHDATEAYLGDMVRPLKNAIPQYKVIEDNMARVIGEALGITVPFDDPRIKAADKEILTWEMAMVRDSQFRAVSRVDDVREAFRAAYDFWGGHRV